MKQLDKATDLANHHLRDAEHHHGRFQCLSHGSEKLKKRHRDRVLAANHFWQWRKAARHAKEFALEAKRLEAGGSSHDTLAECSKRAREQGKHYAEWAATNPKWAKERAAQQPRTMTFAKWVDGLEAASRAKAAPVVIGAQATMLQTVTDPAQLSLF